MEKGKIIRVKTKGEWVRKKKQVLDKGVNLVVDEIDDDVMKCSVIIVP